MPEYAAPGIYVEETGLRPKPIEGVGTNTTGFIGPTGDGPVTGPPTVLTSLADFERLYGGGAPLHFEADGVMPHYLWQAARVFFEEGGKRLYISRLFRPIKGSYPPARFHSAQTARRTDGRYDDGHARASLPSVGGRSAIQIRARFPGAAGNSAIRLTLCSGENLLKGTPADPSADGLVDQDVVWLKQAAGATGDPAGGALYLAESYYDRHAKKRTWRFKDTTAIPPRMIALNGLSPDPDPALSDLVRVVTLRASVTSPTGAAQRWEGLPLDPAHKTAGRFDSFSKRFGPKPSDAAETRPVPIVVQIGTDVKNGLGLLQAMSRVNGNLLRALEDPNSTEADRSVDLLLSGGNDGRRPSPQEYEGVDKPNPPFKTGLKAFEEIEEISLVAAPGATDGYEKGYGESAAATMASLIGHAERMRYRFAILDSGNGQTISEVRAMRGRINSTHAAFYYPWITVRDPISQQESQLPPSGFVAGIYTRSDLSRGVAHPPADEAVRLAVGLETMVDPRQQEMLNPEGINCFRLFEGRGIRLWGARTAGADPEWKYVNLRRYLTYLEQSIDKGTQWTVFEPNGEPLWATVRRTIEDFLLNEWRSGALLGDKPETAYFVRCDRTTMTQDDLDHGRLLILIGVAPLKPAEFVIFRIGQWTAARKD
ncbi:MAG: phage tail sheath subtilisin-like domain-containing protein [Nitrospirae bacterium]|nr:phage tail sheath subtilisin-like domain-containing protein [Candidatus Manganitrophaceae bacterium]